MIFARFRLLICKGNFQQAAAGEIDDKGNPPVNRMITRE